VIAGRTPTLRALLMLTLYFGARAWHRERQALNAVGGAGLALLAWHPLDLFAPGFQLSLGAATLLAGVALPLLRRTSQPLRRATRQLGDAGYDDVFPPRLAQWRVELRSSGWPRLAPRLIRGALGVYDIAAISLILQLGFAAFNGVYFHRASPWAMIANALLVPAAGVLIPLGWLALAAAWTPGLAAGAGVMLTAAARAVLAAAGGLARWPGADWRSPSPPGWFLYVFAAVAAAWLLAARRGWRAWAGATAAMAVCAATVALAPFPPRLPPGLAATILDVGQGDAIFVSFPDGRTLLVDGGPSSAHWDSGEAIVAPFLWSLGLHRLDAVLLTHAHNDHLGGLATVVRDFHPSEIWLTRSLPRDARGLRAFRALLASPAERGVTIRRLAAGDAFLAGASRLQVLLPPPGYLAGPEASNDDSMMLRVGWGGDEMLLAGDAQAAGERWLLQQGVPLASALLKVGHHGSASSSTAAFLAAVHPQAAVISVGRANVYGLPAPAVVARLRAAGARVFRTDRDGAIQCRFEGGWLRVYLFPKPLG
jgi:competence protein ComEC